MECEPGQELAYGEGGVYCAGEVKSQDGGIPNCPEGQVLTGSGGRLVCTTPAVEGGTLCGLAIRRATTGYTSLVRCVGQAIIAQPTPNSWPAPDCPKGYALQEFDVSGTGIVGFLTCAKN
jgi:hypothetical protein